MKTSWGWAPKILPRISSFGTGVATGRPCQEMSKEGPILSAGISQTSNRSNFPPLPYRCGAETFTPRPLPS